MFYFIQQGEWDNNHLRFMYLPVIHTLTNLENHSVTIGNRVRVSDIPYNSTFVWVGVVGRERVPWGELRARGARTVYYQTEPINVCPFTKAKVDELWDFAWFNIEKCQRNPSSPVLRYVPIARQTWTPTLVPNISANLLQFFGDAMTRTACYRNIDREWKVQSQLGVWDETGFERYIRKSPGVFLNIHKQCAKTGPVTFRNSLLLSTNGVVVSARCHPKDEKMYEGLILFVNDVANITRAAVEAHLRTRNMSLFSERFDARTILQKAGLVPEVYR